jgi:hypothetical protein
VPRDAPFALLLADWGKLYGLLGALEACLNHQPLGKKLTQQARAMLAMAPLPVPLSAAELAKLGIDAKRPLLLWGKAAPVVSVGIADLATLRKQLAVLWPKSNGQWSSMTHRNVSVEVLAGVKQLFCSFDARRAQALCSPHTDALVDALGPPPQPQQSLWDQLSPEEQGAATSTTALLWGGPRNGALLARIEEDGISVSGRIAGVPARQVAAIFGEPSPSTLLGLAKGARALLRLRLNARALGGLPPATREELTRLGIAVDKLGDALSGELLAMERRPGEIVVVLSSRDSMVSQQIVDALGRTLDDAARRARDKAAAKKSALPGLKVTKVKLAGRGAYRVDIASTREDLPLQLTLGLAAGPLGVVAGSWPAVEETVKVQSAPTAALRATLATSEERLAFDERSVFAIRSFIGDPIGVFAPAVDALLQSEGAPPQVRAGIELARFLLDQLHRLTVGVVLDRQGTPRFVARLMTLHRDGNAEDDRARAAWIKGLQAKLAGDSATYGRALQELAATYPRTRYAALLERSKGGLLGTALLGTLTAVAVPAFHKYMRRSKMLEVHTHLARLVSTARFIEGSFPKSTPWTPAKPCCGGRAGKCLPDGKAWDHPTWTSLRFALSEPHYYQYRFTSKGKSFSAEARGDLNCDGKTSWFAIEGTREADGGVKLSPMKTKDPEE